MKINRPLALMKLIVLKDELEDVWGQSANIASFIRFAKACVWLAALPEMANMLEGITAITELQNHCQIWIVTYFTALRSLFAVSGSFLESFVITYLELWPECRAETSAAWTGTILSKISASLREHRNGNKDRRASSAAIAQHSAEPFPFHLSDPRCQELFIAVGSYRDSPGWEERGLLLWRSPRVSLKWALKMSSLFRGWWICACNT